MKRTFPLLLFLFISFSLTAQVGKHAIELNSTWLVPSPLMTLGADYHFNFAQRENSFWTGLLGGGLFTSVIPDLDDDDDGFFNFPYSRIGINYNYAFHPRNYFQLGSSLFLYYPEIHVGYFHLFPNRKNSLNIYVSSLLPIGEVSRYFQVGIGYTHYFKLE